MKKVNTVYEIIAPCRNVALYNQTVRILNQRYWQSHNYPIMLVIRDAEDKIRWMNITDYLRTQARKTKSIEFIGEDFTPLNVDNLRKDLYPEI